MFICRKTIKGFDLGKWRDTTGTHGLREAFEEYLRNLNEGEGFNGFFRKEFEGHEATYFRWKSVFDFLGLVEEEEGGDLEEQVGRIMEGEDMDPRSHRRPVETGAIGGRAPGHSQDVEHLGQLSEEGGKIMKSKEALDEALRIHLDVLEKRERTLGRDHIGTIDTGEDFREGPHWHNRHGEQLGKQLSRQEGLLDRVRLLQIAIKTFERTLGKTHPNTFMIIMNEAVIFFCLKNFERAEAMLQRCMDGYIGQVGKDHDDTQRCVMNYKICLRCNGDLDSQRRQVDFWKEYPELWS
ncbi:hypothetical protein TL16_g09055 [Triparma laevis f. inornata]|uniref:Uncharacterized protein n=1 Tax=Triparma laevis f. inornata TaxID=1714386 RepID=A0A9W7ELU2_9STRA|nr:hypothetical protein TL16_g09055 [Triparma laevis f. inornata]